MLILNPLELTIFVLLNCISQVLRKQSGIRTKEDHDAALAGYFYEMGSRHLSHAISTHEFTS